VNPPPGPDASAVELARWQGGIDQKMSEGQERFDRMEKAIEGMDEKLDLVIGDLREVKTKLAMYATVGGLIGSAIVTFIVAIGTNAI
jgi:hypothetical protein